jgi:short-subunit dehydrogenase
MVCPGFTNTGIGRNALGGDGQPARALRTTVGKGADPEQVAEAIYRGVVSGRRLLVLSPVGKLAFVLSRVLPSLYERLMVRSLLRDGTSAGG